MNKIIPWTWHTPRVLTEVKRRNYTASPRTAEATHTTSSFKETKRKARCGGSACNASTREVEAGRSRVQSQLGLHKTVFQKQKTCIENVPSGMD